MVDEIEEFLTGVRAPPPDHRFLATILVARLIASAETAARLGDHRWGERTDHLRQQVNEAIARHGGTPIGISASEIAARFDGPARAVRCALELCALARALKFELSMGLHTGEIEMREGVVSGLALHVTERIAMNAPPGEVLASGLVHDLVVGSGLHFAEHEPMQISGLESLHYKAGTWGRVDLCEDVMRGGGCGGKSSLSCLSSSFWSALSSV